MDIWGQIFRDQMEGHPRPHFIERDDGRAEPFQSAAVYFEAPRSEGERDLLSRLEGPVLDLGAGPGSYSLFLQRQGLRVTAADRSPGAVEVCRRRGCEDARVMDLRHPDIEAGAFRSIIVMGNTLGAHQTQASLVQVLSAFHRGVGPRGRLLCQMVDPLDTLDEAHLRYHERNRQRGLPPGMVLIRMKYKGLVEDWMPLWMPTDDELASLAQRSGWRMMEERREGPHRVRLFEAV